MTFYQWMFYLMIAVNVFGAILAWSQRRLIDDLLKTLNDSTAALRENTDTWNEIAKGLIAELKEATRR